MLASLEVWPIEAPRALQVLNRLDILRLRES